MKDFLNYYQDELLFLRGKSGVFAKKHPEIASRLDLKNGESSDPQTERIIESVAFMAAKLNQKIDENAQDVAFHLLSVLCPNLINVFPPCSVAKFEPSSNVSVTAGIQIPKDSSLFAKSKSGKECLFRTVYPLTLYPITVSNVCVLRNSRTDSSNNAVAIEIEISSEIDLESLAMQNLLFHINSEIIEDALLIYEAIFANPNRTVSVRVGDKCTQLDSKNIEQCGFAENESVCPVAGYSSNSIQLFREMLHFKRKFMFFRITGLDALLAECDVSNIRKFSILIDIDFVTDRLDQIVNIDSIAVNTVPIVNLFQVTSDPFRFDGIKTKYLLLPDQARDSAIEVHSILELHMINSVTKEDNVVQPYFSLGIDTDTNILHDVFWLYSKERSDLRNLPGADTYISFIDTKMNPHSVYADVVYAKTLCTNRLEARNITTLSDMYVDSVETAGFVPKMLYRPSAPVSFTEDTTSMWTLVSQLSSTHISMARAETLWASLKKLISLFAARTSMKAEELLRDVKGIRINETVQRFGNDAWRGFVRGLEVSICVNCETNEAFFSYFLCNFLNQYLSSCISINSFVKLKLLSSKSGKQIASWNATSGNAQPL
ncbi:MAG: type VI secretion system baseplate subunit TssF [Holosporales bacterium]|nr:type VI secretion system baseplate subunit TssF [Holosporales bacterium]